MVYIGGLSPDYVLDRMQPYEIRILISNVHLKIKDGWEQTRLLIATVANIFSGKGHKVYPEDVLKFDWDNDKVESSCITEDDSKQLQAEAEEIKKILINY